MHLIEAKLNTSGTLHNRSGNVKDILSRNNELKLHTSKQNERSIVSLSSSQRKFHSNLRRTRWDDDTEDSGVDSVSSVVEGDLNNCRLKIPEEICQAVNESESQTTYSDVIVNNKVNRTKEGSNQIEQFQQKSFLHNVYGSSLNDENLVKDVRSEMGSNNYSKHDSGCHIPNSPLRKNIQKIIAKYSVANASDPKRALASKVCSKSANGTWHGPIRRERNAVAHLGNCVETYRSPAAATDTAKNFFLNSLLEMEDISQNANIPSKTGETNQRPSSPVEEDHLVPRLMELLDAVEIQSTGPDSLLLISRNGTRASLRLTLKSGKNLSSVGNSLVHKNSFNRAHRGSKRSSQRRNGFHKDNNIANTNAVTKRPPSPETTQHRRDGLQDGKVNNYHLVKQNTEAVVEKSNLVANTKSEINSRKTRTSIHRRPSQAKYTSKKTFSMSVAIPPSKVATLASKFNSLINENKTTGMSDKSQFSSRDSSSKSGTSPSKFVPCNTQQAQDRTTEWRESRRSQIDCISETDMLTSESGKGGPEMDSPSQEKSKDDFLVGTRIGKPKDGLENTKMEAASGQILQPDVDVAEPYKSRFPEKIREPMSDPLRRKPNCNIEQSSGYCLTRSSQGVYGTVKSIVKQAIRKFEKMENNVVSPIDTVSRSIQNNCDSSHAMENETVPNDNNTISNEQPNETETTCPLMQRAHLIPEGIAPNNSFLWRDRQSIQNLIYEATMFSTVDCDDDFVHKQQQGKCDSYCEVGTSQLYSTLRSNQSNTYDVLHGNKNYETYNSSSSNGYDSIGPPRIPGYDEVHPNNQSSSYDLGSTPSVKYDDIKPPAATYDKLTFKRQISNGYDELHPPSSSDGYIDPSRSSPLGYEQLLTSTTGGCRDEDTSTVRYEECGSPAPFVANSSTSGLVTAVPALVCEDQMDSISYFYDDIHGYGGSHHSYEPIYARVQGTPIPSLSKCNDAKETAHSPMPDEEPDSQAHDQLSDDSQEIHEVYSYRLIHIGNEVVPDSPAPSLATSRAGTERRSETSDEWVDISDGDVDEPVCVVTRPRHDPAFASFSRRGHRQSRRRLSASKGTWSQTMRNLFRNGFNKATSLSREAFDKKIKQPSSENHRRLFSKKTSAQRLPSAETEASGTGSSQTWEECGESEGDDLANDHHYEALYEVINPAVQHPAVVLVDHTDDSFDDSFDSDDPFEEETVVRNLDATSDTSRERPGSRSGSERSKESEDPLLRTQYGIARFAEAAGAQMRRLRRNWSTTKTDISRSINRMKMRSTVSVAELGEVFKSPWREHSPEKVTPPKPNPSSNNEQKKGTWALRQFRRRSAVTSPNGQIGKQPSPMKKESSTFYLTVTIEPDTENGNQNTQVNDSTSTESESTPSPVPPLVHTNETSSLSNVSVRSRKTSSASAHGSIRPRTAPPDPPIKFSEANTPLKRPLARLTNSYSESRLAVDKLSLLNEIRLQCQETLYCDVAVGALAKKKSEQDLNIVSPTTDTPYSRLSLASSTSRNSSEAYIRVQDLASSPDLCSKDRKRADEVQSYIDLQPPTEAEESYFSSHFADEPLYQFYTAEIIERAAHNQGELSEEDDYEVIGQRHDDKTKIVEAETKARLPTAMELVMPASGRRTLWCELPEVINSGILETISAQQRKLQEAMFELITSEASYLRSLNVLTTHFIQCPEFLNDAPGERILSRIERHTLFSDIVPVRECSERLLADFEKRWQESVFIREICDILLVHASKYFEVYIKYCRNQLHQERKLRELKDNNPQFLEVLRRLESSPECQSLAMHSFLMLPMQRITRLPLLVDAIFHRLENGTPEYERCRLTLATLNKIVQECNEEARKAERIHEMLIVSNQLDFADVKAISIMSASRWLVKKGELQRLSWRDIDARLTFGRKIHKQTVYLFLFTDLLVITKKKSDDNYTVLDYCPRNMIQVEEYTRTEKITSKSGSEMGKNLIFLTMLQNHENKTVEMILSCSSESDRTRWLEAVTPRTSDNPEEKIYEEWDCPQVQAVHSYVATQPDELSLDVSDVVNVLRKMADGWYQGERLRDGERGWFPGNYTVEIASAHVRARNLRQRYRLLALSGSFLEERARKEKGDQRRKSKKLSLE